MRTLILALTVAVNLHAFEPSELLGMRQHELDSFLNEVESYNIDKRTDHYTMLSKTSSWDIRGAKLWGGEVYQVYYIVPIPHLEGLISKFDASCKSMGGLKWQTLEYDIEIDRMPDKNFLIVIYYVSYRW